MTLDAKGLAEIREELTEVDCGFFITTSGLSVDQGRALLALVESQAALLARVHLRLCDAPCACDVYDDGRACVPCAVREAVEGVTP